MIYTTFSIPTVQTATIRARNWWVNGGQASTLRAVERGAEAFSNGFTQAMLDAIESGIIVRRWWESQGKESFVRGIALAVMALACLACVIGFAVAAAVKATPVAYRWVSTVGAPVVVKVLDKTCALVLCYEEPAAAESVAKGAEPTEAERLIEWSVARWSQLATLR